MATTSRMAEAVLYQRYVKQKKEKKQRVREPPKGVQMFVSGARLLFEELIRAEIAEF